jgi:hypothetical protein
VSKLGETYTLAGFRGTGDKVWSEDSHKKSAQAVELDTWFTTTPYMTAPIGSGSRVFCPGCNTYVESTSLNSDHQVAFSTLRKKVHELAHYASLSQDHEDAIRRSLPKFDDYFKRDSQGNWAPSQRMIFAYSNDLANLLRICSGCNSVVGGKSTLDAVAWFKQTPIFGEQFVKWATENYTSKEFFGNPSPTKGWGKAARDWLETIGGQFTDLIRGQEMQKDTRIKDFVFLSTEVIEAEQDTTPQAPVRKKKAREKLRTRRLSVKASIKTEEQLSKVEDMEEYSAGSDEEGLADKIATSTVKVVEDRSTRKRARTIDYTEAFAATLKRTGTIGTSKAAQEGVEAARQRIEILKHMAMAKLLNLPYTGPALEGTQTSDNQVLKEAELEYKRVVEGLITQAKTDASTKKPAPVVPITTPGVTFGGMPSLSIFAEIQRLVNQAHWDETQRISK